MPFREKRPDERVFRQLVPFSRPVCRADWRKSARLFAYSPGVHCRDGLPAGGDGIRTVGPTFQPAPQPVWMRIASAGCGLHEMRPLRWREVDSNR